MRLHWKLEIYDQSGNTDTVVTHIPNSESIVSGSLNALAEALPDITRLNRFFIERDSPAAAAYTAFAEAWETTYGETLQPWATLKADPAKAATVTTWHTIAAAAANVDPILN